MKIWKGPILARTGSGFLAGLTRVFSPLYRKAICGIFQIVWRKNGDVVATVLLKILPLASVAN
jgi:hypothetical protein